ncbi:MAG: M24 family metallopeptidase [Gemmatimonadaceae bacterium]
MLNPQTLPQVQRALRDAGLDGWLIFDFQGSNSIAAGILGLTGMVTRRIFAYVPREGAPVAVTHNIEQGPWRDWPREWGRERYSSWRALEGALATLVRGRRVAMEYSPGDAVPYVDRVPAGVLEMVRAAGADVVSSAELVSRFYAAWTPDQLASHRRAAEVVAQVARDATAHAGERASAGAPVAEHELAEWVLERFRRAGLETDHGPIVAAGANAADPHYEPASKRARQIVRGDVLLLDLWAREPGGIYADQTWMASLGDPSTHATEVWDAVCSARDAAISLVRERAAAGAAVKGAELDDAARSVIRQHGLGEYFTHRTGHSIDARSLHGAGPHLDNFETREERLLIPGVGFSIEPGVYLAGDVGVRSEVNAYMGSGEAIITPSEYQRELLIV